MLQKLPKLAHKNGTTLKEEALKTGLINEREFLKIVNPKKWSSQIIRLFFGLTRYLFSKLLNFKKSNRPKTPSFITFLLKIFFEN